MKKSSSIWLIMLAVIILGIGIRLIWGFWDIGKGNGPNESVNPSENKFGFLEGASGSDVFLHQSQWLGHGKPVESQLVYFELEEQKGKWSANNAKALTDVPRDKQIELGNGKHLSHGHERRQGNHQKRPER